MGDTRPPEWTPIPTEWNGRRGASRPPEWRKSPGGFAKEWRGGSSRPRTIRPATERAGGRFITGRFDPQWGGRGGVKSWQNDSNPQTNGGGVESSWDDSTPRKRGGTEGDKTPESLTAYGFRQEEDGRGLGGGDKNPLPTRPTQDKPTDGGDGAAPRGAAAMGTVEAAARTETGSRGAGHPAAHPTGAALAAATGSPVGGDHARRGGETNNDAGYLPEHSLIAAQGALVGA